MKLPRPLARAADWLRYDLPQRLRGASARGAAIGAGVVLLVGVAAWAIVSGPLSEDEQGEAETRVVTVAVETDDERDAPVGELGFPLVATRNTTRVGGADPVADAAAIALATHPPAPGAETVEAAVLVGADDWQGGIAAGVLTGPPLRLPLLISTPGEVPQATADALAKLDPRAGSGPADVGAYRIGDAAAPDGLAADQLEGAAGAELANEVDKLRARLAKVEPEHIVIASSERAAYAMPAAGWAARSGDPVLFSGREEVPEATLEALRRHSGVAVYVLGPESVISDEALRRIERVSPGVQRVGAEGPVANAIAFARYADASFGWNINDPGHGFVVANASRPLDAAAAAPLSASGKWGPLLLVESASALPGELRSFLLDVKPGFEDDPTRALYNHIWLIGDTGAIGARVQAEIDELAELTEVGPGAGGPVSEAGAGTTPAPTGPGRPEQEPEPQVQKKGSDR